MLSQRPIASHGRKRGRQWPTTELARVAARILTPAKFAMIAATLLKKKRRHLPPTKKFKCCLIVPTRRDEPVALFYMTGAIRSSFPADFRRKL